jgi:hypothetical protein
MFQAGAVNDILNYLALTGYFAVLIKLWHANLVREHRWFALYMTVVPLRLLALMLLPNGTRLYGDVYFFTLPFIAFLSALVVLEVYKLVLSQHQGLMKMGRRVIVIALFLGTSAALLLHEVGSSEYASDQPLLERLLTIERSITLVLTIFVLAIASFLSYFPVSLSRNSLLHTVILSTYFLSRTGALWVRNAFGKSIDSPINLFTSLIVLGCIAGWLILLRPEAKDRVMKSGPRFSAADEARILGQLQALNRTLMRSARE